MIKSIVVLVMSALLVSVALAEEKTKEQCVEESANIISTVSVSEDVKHLLNITHGFYSNLRKMIAAPEPSPEFIQALENVTYPHGCRKIFGDFGKLDPCYDHFDDPDQRFVLEIVDHEPETEERFEAINVCDVLLDIREQKLRRECAKKGADILSRVRVDESVMKLVEVSPESYSNLEEIIEADEPSLENEEAMTNATYPDGCRKIDKGLKQIGYCYQYFLGKDQSLMLDIVGHKPETEELFEVLKVCNAIRDIREQKLRQKCAKKGAGILSRVHVDESVMKLVEVSRESYSNLEEIIEAPEPSPKYKQAMTYANYPDGCRKIDEGLKKIGYCYQYFLGKDQRFMLDIVGQAPETEKIFEADYACEAAKSVPIHRV